MREENEKIKTLTKNQKKIKFSATYVKILYEEVLYIYMKKN